MDRVARRPLSPCTQTISPEGSLGHSRVVLAHSVVPPMPPHCFGAGRLHPASLPAAPREASCPTNRPQRAGRPDPVGVVIPPQAGQATGTGAGREDRQISHVKLRKSGLIDYVKIGTSTDMDVTRPLIESLSLLPLCSGGIGGVPTTPARERRQLCSAERSCLLRSGYSSHSPSSRVSGEGMPAQSANARTHLVRTPFRRPAG